MSNTIKKIASLIVMVVSFIAYVAKAPAFPIASENLLPWSTWFFISAIANIVLWQRVIARNLVLRVCRQYCSDNIDREGGFVEYRTNTGGICRSG